MYSGKAIFFYALVFLLILLLIFFVIRFLQGDQFVVKNYYGFKNGGNKCEKNKSGSSSGSSSSDCDDKKKKKHCHKKTDKCCQELLYSIGDIPDAGVLISAGVNGGIALGLGSSQGLNTAVPSSTGQIAMSHMAGELSRCTVLKRLKVTLTATVSAPGTVVRLAIWRASCPDNEFIETPLKVRATEVTGTSTTFCLDDSCDPVSLKPGDRIVPYLSIETTNSDVTATVTQCSVGFLACCCDEKDCREPCCVSNPI